MLKTEQGLKFQNMSCLILCDQVLVNKMWKYFAKKMLMEESLIKKSW